jgi:hypothetical protein
MFDVIMKKGLQIDNERLLPSHMNDFPAQILFDYERELHRGKAKRHPANRMPFYYRTGSCFNKY